MPKETDDGSNQLREACPQSDDRQAHKAFTRPKDLGCEPTGTLYQALGPQRKRDCSSDDHEEILPQSPLPCCIRVKLLRKPCGLSSFWSVVQHIQVGQ